MPANQPGQYFSLCAKSMRHLYLGVTNSWINVNLVTKKQKYFNYRGFERLFWRIGFRFLWDKVMVWKRTRFFSWRIRPDIFDSQLPSIHAKKPD